MSNYLNIPLFDVALFDVALFTASQLNVSLFWYRTINAELY